MKSHSLPVGFEEKLEAYISGIEKRTSIEFVPVILKRCSDYNFFKSQIFWVLLTFELLIFRLLPVHKVPMAVELLAAVGLGWILSKLVEQDFIFRKLLPKKWQHQAVEKKAAEIFLKEEVFNTKARSGLLIMISVFEESVFLFADKGLLQKIPASQWQTLGVQLAKDFDRARPGTSFFEALDEVMKEAEKHFPPCATNPNEIKNHLRKE